MITACPHCGSKYELPDKMLGRQARCKSCSKMFLIAPLEGAEQSSPEAEAEVFTPPKRTGSTAQLNPVRPQETYVSDDPLDPLDALASAASGEEPAYSRPSPRSNSGYRDRYDEDRPVRSKKARGAGAAMGLGITAAGFTVAACACGLTTMLSGDNKSLIAVMGVITIVLTIIATALAMMAVVNGTSATGRIRKARHPLSGRSEASTGSITGGISLLLILALVIASSIWLINRGGLNFEEVVTESQE